MSAVEPLQAKIDAHRELTERNEALQQELKAATTSFTNAAMDETVRRTLISEWTARAGNPNEPPPKQPRDIRDIHQATSIMQDLYRYRSERLYFGLMQSLRDEEGAPLAQIRGTIRELEHEYRANEKTIARLFQEITKERERVNATYERFVDRQGRREREN